MQPFLHKSCPSTSPLNYIRNVMLFRSKTVMNKTTSIIAYIILKRITESSYDWIRWLKGLENNSLLWYDFKALNYHQDDSSSFISLYLRINFISLVCAPFVNPLALPYLGVVPNFLTRNFHSNDPHCAFSWSPIRESSIDFFNRIVPQNLFACSFNNVHDLNPCLWELWLL